MVYDSKILKYIQKMFEEEENQSEHSGKAILSF